MWSPEQRVLASGMRYGVKTAWSVLEEASVRLVTSDYMVYTAYNYGLERGGRAGPSYSFMWLS